MTIGEKHKLVLDLSSKMSADLPPAYEIEIVGKILLTELSKERGLTHSCELSLFVVDDEEMSDINNTHRNCNYPTDVLSFPLLSNGLQEEIGVDFPIPGERQQIGDIFISGQSCLRQAREIGHTTTDEFYRLLTHGMLHLFFYDHITLKDARKMEKREDVLLELITNIDFNRFER